MAVFEPDATIQMARPPGVYGWLVQEPQIISSLASQWHDQAGTGVDGRYHKASGETHGTAVLKRQDTYLDGTTNRLGFPFVAVAGTWKDDFKHPRYNTFCLGMPTGEPSAPGTPLNQNPAPVAEVVAKTATADIEHAEMWLQWGLPPVSTYTTDVAYQRVSRYTYVHLAYQSPDGQDYRIAFEYGQPIRLDVRYGANNNGTSSQSVPPPGQTPNGGEGRETTPTGSRAWPCCATWAISSGIWLPTTTRY